SVERRSCDDEAALLSAAGQHSPGQVGSGHLPNATRAGDPRRRALFHRSHLSTIVRFFLRRTLSSLSCESDARYMARLNPAGESTGFPSARTITSPSSSPERAATVPDATRSTSTPCLTPK